ncbi:hypothetical protein MLD38_024731 [Melastoma candidum]|uniref:Uncharacterized protein n=1 Tax=Melastoma candidum TaxID=119954 RepID=A0ACB9NUS2_9MYRT|nr:hypothetical protein MLD38_024731 [Melastoma candidum]
MDRTDGGTTRDDAPGEDDLGERGLAPGAVVRADGNKCNWILVWEVGFCDFYECERGAGGFNKGRFGLDVFFKMAHEVYSYGEGVVGKVAADNGHKWVFRETLTDNDLNYISSWNAAAEPQPKAWEFQFYSGIETIAVILVREGIVQLGSLNKVIPRIFGHFRMNSLQMFLRSVLIQIAEDPDLLISIQRKFGYLQSIPDGRGEARDPDGFTRVLTG